MDYLDYILNTCKCFDVSLLINNNNYYNYLLITNYYTKIIQMSYKKVFIINLVFLYFSLNLYF